MLQVNKNLKDTQNNQENSVSQNQSNTGISHNGYVLSNHHSYTKTDKLITALYMVTDTMEHDEPMRLKLRTLGTEILSDISLNSLNIYKGHIQKIDTVMSFLNIASDLRMISEMNFNILKKEFVLLKESLESNNTQNQLWLKEFISEPNEGVLDAEKNDDKNFIGQNTQIKGHTSNNTKLSTRLGVQKGSTLLKALSGLNNKINTRGDVKDTKNFETIKQNRREKIIKIIKDTNGISIKDIVISLHNIGENIGEKTLQRELISMVKDGVLKKTGDKRWSNYSIFA